MDIDNKKETKPAGMKHDNGKAPMDLISPIASAYLAKVLGFGASKYAYHNWRKGIKYSRLIAAMERHLTAIKAGIDDDAETGYPHAAHLMCEAMFMLEFLTLEMEKTKELDDRFHLNTTQKDLLAALLASE